MNSRSPAFLLALLAGVAAVALHTYALIHPVLIWDDFQILEASWTWRRAWDSLWLPANEHTMPLGRLTTAVLVHLPTGLPGLPLLARLHGVVAVWLGMGLVYVFVRRELGHVWYGLLAMILFGVTTVYDQAVMWFAASFSVFALDTLLLALLAAQRWRQAGRPAWLVLCAVGTALAPAWFASGVLAGPLCTVYLLAGIRNQESGIRNQESGIGNRPTKFLIPDPRSLIPDPRSLIPLFGTAAFLAVSLPRTAEHILHLEHYQGMPVTKAFQPLVGLGNTGRSVVDNLLPGTVGLFFGIPLPVPIVVVSWVGLAAGLVWWWWRAPQRPLVLLGSALILTGYWLVYSARAEWGYEDVEMYMPNWNRYHLLPHLGLVLLVMGGLPRWQGYWFTLDPAGGLSRQQARVLALLVAGLFAVQVPRSIIAHYYDRKLFADQQEVLRHIEVVDALCREQQISADTARAAFGPGAWLEVPGCDGRVNGWAFLRGSDDPREWNADEARRALSAP